MRKYQPIWEAIKSQPKGASLRAPVATHKRIIQAVRKEKWRDAGWRLMLSEKGQKLFLLETISGEVITFSLEEAKSDDILKKL